MKNGSDGWRLGERQRTSLGEVAYGVFGEEGPPVVLVHGTPTRSYLWRDVAPTLAGRHRVYAYDLLGFGDSERREGQDLSIAAQARLLKELVDAWGLSGPVAVGHDIGGGIVLRAHLLEGVTFREIALVDAVVVTPWMPEANEHFEAHMDAYRTMPPHLFEAIVAAHFREATNPEMDEEAWEEYLSQWRGEEGKLAFLTKEEGLRERDTAELEPRLGEVAVPVLVVWGEEDAWLDPSQADRLGEAIPNSRVKKIPGVGHFVPEDAPEELARELLGFLLRGRGWPLVLSASVLVAAALAAFSAGVLSGFTGFGHAAIVVPLLLLVYELRTVVALAGVLSLAVAAAVVLDSWRAADRRLATALLLAAFPGLWVGAEILRVVDPAYLKLAVGVLVVTAALLFVREVKLPGARTRWGTLVAGFTSGALATSTGLSGPPAALLLEERGLPKRAFRASISLYFFGLDLVLLAVLALRGLLAPGLAVLAPGLLALPALFLLVAATLVGKALGTTLLDRVSQKAFRAVVLATVVLTGALGVVTALGTLT